MRVWEVTFTRTQHAKCEVQAETFEDAEDKADALLCASDFTFNDYPGSLQIDSEEIDKVLSCYVIDTSLSAFEIYAYDLEDAIYKARQLLKDDIEIYEEGCYPKEEE